MATTYAIPDGRVAMAATLYTGNSATRSVSNTVNGVGFQPDFLWIKARSAAYGHVIQDSVRGVSSVTDNVLQSQSTAAEFNANSGGGTQLCVTSFDTGGFSLGPDSYYLNFNNNGVTYVGWQWKAGGTAVSNTAGSITSSVSANTTAGFSVVTYTGTGANATVGHGLGVAPSMVIVKNRTSGSTDVWLVQHSSLGATKYIILDRTDAAGTASTPWNNTAPTSSVFSIGSLADVNRSTNTFVAYCFAPVAGYSAMGSYTGNGSTDGPFVFLNFRPRYVMIKRTDAVGDWYVFDTGRDPYNATTYGLIPNSAGTDTSYTGWGDLLSNGFKIRRTDGAWNASGGTYIYYAVAENPFKFANAR